jgi:hypothetical protein
VSGGGADDRWSYADDRWSYLAWLCHPALTGLPAREWDTLIAALMSLHHQQRKTRLDERRGHRPRLAAPGTGRRPVISAGYSCRGS